MQKKLRINGVRKKSNKKYPVVYVCTSYNGARKEREYEIKRERERNKMNGRTIKLATKSRRYGK